MRDSLADPSLAAQAREALKLSDKDAPRAEALAREILAAALKAGDRKAVLLSRYALGWIAVDAARFEEAAALAAEGLAELAAAGEPASPKLLNLEGSAYRYLGMRGLAVERLQAAAALARSSGRAEDQYPVLNNLALVLLDVGEAEKALELHFEAEAAADAAGAAAALLGIRSNRGRILIELGRTEEAVPTLEETIAGAREPGLEPILADALAELGRAKTLLGKLKEGEADLRAAREIERRLSRTAKASQAREVLAENLLAQGRLAEAEAESRAACEAARVSGFEPLLSASVLLRARALEALGRYREAAEAYRERIELDEARNKAEGRAALRGGGRGEGF